MASASRSRRAVRVRDLELLGDLGHRGPAPRLEEEEGGNEAIGPHRPQHRTEHGHLWPRCGQRCRGTDRTVLRMTTPADER